MTDRPDSPHRTEGAEPDALDATLAHVRAEPARGLGDLPHRLPVAPWEGAAYRAWGVVLIAVLAVAGLAAVLFAVVGISPLDGVRAAARLGLWSRAAMSSLSSSFGTMVHAAPRGMQLAVGIGFLVVNAVLIAMLRRGPRGYDVRSR
ncbi:MAG: hypothetical protein ACRD2J_18090 [Thermoanaerobaculia bacterium]